jgi:methylated-DNA-[protein]-cysteine S-methyltransferase
MIRETEICDGLLQTLMDTPLGLLLLTSAGNELISVDYISGGEHERLASLVKLERLEREFSAYFKNSDHRFGLPLRLCGTGFQQRVWKELRKIPAGSVMTYGELADKLRTSARAVGNACRSNPCPIVIPCHRVVSVNGLGGYGGHTTGPVAERKRWLLRHEGVING